MPEVIIDAKIKKTARHNNVTGGFFRYNIVGEVVGNRFAFAGRFLAFRGKRS